MKRGSHNQVGFGIILVVVTLAILALLGTASWLVYRHDRPEVTNAQSGTSKTTTQQTTTTTPAPTVGYLDIKEWGVQFPLNDSIKDAYYIVSTSFSNDPDGLPSGVWLGLNSLTDASCNAASNNTGGKTGAIGDILRVPRDAIDPVSGKPYSQKYPNGVTINGYYYGYQSWASDTACIQKSSVTSADTGFAEAAKGISQVSTSN